MILFVVFAFLVQSLFILQRFAGVARVEGTVEYQRRGEGAWQPVTEKTLLQTDDVVRTTSNATAELHWLDGTRLRLAPSTTMTIKKSTYNTLKHTQTSLFRLDLGKVWVRIIRTLSHSSKFAVETPTATAAVRGTIFSVAVAEKTKETKVSVYDGTVEVTSSATPVSVPPGFSARVTTFNAAPAVANIPSEEAQEWKGQTGIISPALDISHPSDQHRTSRDKVIVIGSVEPGATLWLNDKRVLVNRLGGFKKTVPLDEGSNRLVFRVKDNRGVESRIVRTVVRTTGHQPVRSS
jgi:hypothetical protein